VESGGKAAVTGPRASRDDRDGHSGSADAGTGPSGDGELDRLLFERAELLASGQYDHDDDAVVQLDMHIRRAELREFGT
jgi:hypothetical protein